MFWLRPDVALWEKPLQSFLDHPDPDKFAIGIFPQKKHPQFVSDLIEPRFSGLANLPLYSCSLIDTFHIKNAERVALTVMSCGL